MTTAKHRALDIVRRERTARTFAPELARVLESEWTLAPAIAEAFDTPVIRDEQLRMMFSCCHPRVPEEAQVALVLNIICGFGAAEIASAFLTGRAAVEKRISRGKKVLAGSKRLFDLADSQFESRLSAVRRALYLLFNEGYHGASAGRPVREELCGEAIRLTTLLLEAPAAAQPETYALAALMCLQAARLPARLDAAGDLSPLVEQDRSRWDAGLVAQGLAFPRPVRDRRDGDGLSRRGRDCVDPRDGSQRRRHRLEHHRRALHPADGDGAVSGRGAQSRDCDRAA